jgi:hypothetical protein
MLLCFSSGGEHCHVYALLTQVLTEVVVMVPFIDKRPTFLWGQRRHLLLPMALGFDQRPMALQERTPTKWRWLPVRSCMMQGYVICRAPLSRVPYHE